MQYFKKEDVLRFDPRLYRYIICSKQDAILEIILNRPEKRNAFTPTMIQEITLALSSAFWDDDVRCVIIRANGPVFCAGADLQAFHDEAFDIKNPDLPAVISEITLGNAFRTLYKPCIAQIEGPLLAGGFLIVAGCTFAIASERATFSLPEVKRGIWPMQVMASLLSIMPARKILQISMTGKIYSVTDALNWGVVTKISDQESISEEAFALARQIAGNAPLAISSGMRAMDQLSVLPEHSWHDFLKEELNNLVKSEDALEGVRAFKEKREPVWKRK